MLAQLSGTNCLKHSATLILPPLLKPPSRRTCLIIISKLFFTALPIPSSDTVCVLVCVCVCAYVCVCVCVCVCVHVCVVSVTVKRHVLPPSVVDGRSRNPFYYYLLESFPYFMPSLMQLPICFLLFHLGICLFLNYFLGGGHKKKGSRPSSPPPPPTFRAAAAMSTQIHLYLQRSSTPVIISLFQVMINADTHSWLFFRFFILFMQ